MTDDEATTAIDEWAAVMLKLHTEPCEGCGTVLQKRASELPEYAGRWQYETWAVERPDHAFEFVEHTHDRCAEVRNARKAPTPDP